MRNRFNILIIIAVLVAIFAILSYFIWKSISKKDKNEETEKKNENTGLSFEQSIEI